MKYLKLLVDGNVIKYDPECSFDGLHQGMTETVRLTFDFSPEWKNRPKVVAFYSLSNKEYPPMVLKNKSCIIPAEVLTNQAFRVQILGKDETKTIRTTQCTIYLEGGNV